MDVDHQSKFDRNNLVLSEIEAINIITNWKENDELYDLRHLQFIVTPDLELQEYLEIKGLYIGTNILREKLGFDNTRRPGDFDIIIIPYTEKDILFERAGVCVVKVVRPTRSKPKKNANSLGLTQLNGLIQDGFPFVGLIHISTTEPLHNNEKTKVDFCTLPVGDKIPFDKGKKLEDYLIEVKMDFFQGYSAEKQMKRLIATELPKFVALLCVGLGLKKDGSFYMDMCPEVLRDFEKGYFNPHVKEETLDKIRKHFEENREAYSKKKLRE